MTSDYGALAMALRHGYSERMMMGITRPGRNIRLLLEYDGSPFHGWQVQPKGPTVQETLEHILERITGERTFLRASGRTDSGVHALGQVANFFTGSRLSVEIFPRAINSLAPSGIAVLEARAAPPDFDARYSAIAKTYRYLILARRHRSALEAGRCWHIPVPLYPARMRKAGFLLEGKKDFSSFRAAGCSARNPVRTLHSLTVRQRGEHIIIEARGDGFLRYMVRAIVGTLVDVGRGNIDPLEIPGILKARDRSRAGRTAPARGLYLLSVEYPDTITWNTPPRKGIPIPA